MKRFLCIALVLVALIYGVLLSWSIPKWRAMYEELYGGQPLAPSTARVLACPALLWVTIGVTLAGLISHFGNAKHPARQLVLPILLLFAWIAFTLVPLFLSLVIIIGKLE